MKIGDSIDIRCPKCGGSDLLIFEAFTVYATWEVVGARLAEYSRPGSGMVQPTGQLSGDCQRLTCGHRWKLRGSPLLKKKGRQIGSKSDVLTIDT